MKEETIMITKKRLKAHLITAYEFGMNNSYASYLWEWINSLKEFGGKK